MMGDENSLKMSAPQLFRFGIDSVLKILNLRMTESIIWLINDQGVCRNSPTYIGSIKNIYTLI